jgi:hypothetical protein
MIAAKYDLIMEQGATFQEQFLWTQADGDPVDMTNFDLRMQIRPYHDAPNYILEGEWDGGTLTPTGDIVFSTIPAFGLFNITISAAIMETLVFVSGVYDIEVDTGTAIIRLVEGSVELNKEVTR